MPTDPVRPLPPPVLDDRLRQARVTWRGLPRRRADDLYHHLLLLPWTGLAALVLALYLGLNLLFAGLYAVGGPCVAGAQGFWDLFFFSVQTMATIGYGGMTPATRWADAVVAVEALTGLVGFAMGTGLMLAKFTRPTARVAFARCAVVGTRNGQRQLMVRMANLRQNTLVEASLNVVLYRDEISPEGHRLRRLVDLPLQRSRTPIFAVTWTAFHPIDADSPLAGLDERRFQEEIAGVLVSLTGLDATFHQTVYAQHLYGAGDVVWGAIFADMMEVLPNGGLVVDHGRLHEVVREER